MDEPHRTHHIFQREKKSWAGESVENVLSFHLIFTPRIGEYRRVFGPIRAYTRVKIRRSLSQNNDTTNNNKKEIGGMNLSLTVSHLNKKYIVNVRYLISDCSLKELNVQPAKKKKSYISFLTHSVLRN